MPVVLSVVGEQVAAGFRKANQVEIQGWLFVFKDKNAVYSNKVSISL